MTTLPAPQNLPKWRRYLTLIAGFLVLFTGLCTLFALVVTAALAWREHVQSKWPEVAARVEQCGLDMYPYESGSYWIDCRIRYEIRGEAVVARVHSRTIPAPERLVWQYPPAQFGRLEDWVTQHPQGTSIAVHYDPANLNHAMLVTTDMPPGGPQTPNNLRLLETAAASCVLSLAFSWIVRPRSDAAGIHT